MSLTVRTGLGFTLGVDPTGGTSFTTIASLVAPPKRSGAKADTPDVTILSDTWKQFAKSQIDPGEVTFTIAYDPNDTVTTTLTSLLSQITPTPKWQISYPAGTGSGATEPFKAHLSGMSQTIEVDKLVTAEITLKVSGAPGFAGE